MKYLIAQKALSLFCSQGSTMLSYDGLMEVHQKLNFAISQSTAALAVSFIILITPWTFKEVVEGCVRSKVSLIKNP